MDIFHPGEAVTSSPIGQVLPIDIHTPPEKMKETFVSWVSSKHTGLVRLLIGDPTDIDISGWPESFSLATKYLEGDRTSYVVSSINEKLTDLEKAKPDPLDYWSRKVTMVKAPYSKFVYHVAEGVKRRAVEKSEVLLTSPSMLTYLGLQTDTIKDVYGENYEHSQSLYWNLAQNKVGGAIARALEYKNSLTS